MRKLVISVFLIVATLALVFSGTQKFQSTAKTQLPLSGLPSVSSASDEAGNLLSRIERLEESQRILLVKLNSINRAATNTPPPIDDLPSGELAGENLEQLSAFAGYDAGQASIDTSGTERVFDEAESFFGQDLISRVEGEQFIHQMEDAFSLSSNDSAQILVGECRTNICRLELQHSSHRVPELPSDLRAAEGWNGKTLTRTEYDQNIQKFTTVVFLTRNGAKVPF